MACPLCNRIEAGDFIAANERAVAFTDAFPVSREHSLVVPRSHVQDLFSLPPDDLAALGELLLEVRRGIAREESPDGFNIGVNEGEAAGQTIPHAHVHVITRYQGDVADPRGGLRWVIPDKAAYWEE